METSSWQTKLSTVRERNLNAFNKSLFCDVEFSVLDSNEGRVAIQAHKYVLAIGSPVFEAMFYGELAETGQTIDLPDCTKEGLQEMLRYIYSDEVSLTGSNVMQVLYLAKKYMLPFLEQKCREYLEEQLQPEDVFTVLPQLKQLGDDKLEQHCWDMVDRETERAVSSEQFLDVPHEVLCQVLVRESLKIREHDLFQAVDKWVLERIKERGIENSGENKRAILGEETIRLIRFPLMSQQEFAGNVLPSKILNTDETAEVIQIFSSLPPSTKIFNRKRRGFSVSAIIPSWRFNALSPSTWNYNGIDNDAIDFRVNKSVSLVGVLLFGSQGKSYEVDLKIYQNHTILSSICSSFLTEDKMIDDEYYGFIFTLHNPVSLTPEVMYTIEAKIQGPNSCYGARGKNRVIYGNLVIQYFRSAKSTIGTSASSGQFPTIILES